MARRWKDEVQRRAGLAVGPWHLPSFLLPALRGALCLYRLHGDLGLHHIQSRTMLTSDRINEVI